MPENRIGGSNVQGVVMLGNIKITKVVINFN